jgi:uncharacterized protein with GYD domain
MPKFIRMGRLTAQGIKNIKNFKQMVEDAKRIMYDHGIKMEVSYCTIGDYDMIAVLDAPDMASMAVTSVLLAREGNFDVETLPALSVSEFTEQVSKS